MNGETRRTEKYKKRCSQMPKKTTITRHHVSLRLAKAKKSSTREKCWQGCETTALPGAVGTNGKRTITTEHSWAFLIKLKVSICYTSATSFLGRSNTGKTGA